MRWASKRKKGLTVEANKITIYTGILSCVNSILGARSSDENRKELHNVFLTNILNTKTLIATDGKVIAGAFLAPQSKIWEEIEGELKEGVYTIKTECVHDVDRYWADIRITLESCDDAHFPQKALSRYLREVETFIQSPCNFHVDDIDVSYQITAFFYGKNDIINPARIDFLPRFCDGYNVYESPYGGSLFIDCDYQHIFAYAMPIDNSRNKMQNIFNKYKKTRKD